MGFSNAATTVPVFSSGPAMTIEQREMLRPWATRRTRI